MSFTTLISDSEIIQFRCTTLEISLVPFFILLILIIRFTQPYYFYELGVLSFFLLFVLYILVIFCLPFYRLNLRSYNY